MAIEENTKIDNVEQECKKEQSNESIVDNLFENMLESVADQPQSTSLYNSEDINAVNENESLQKINYYIQTANAKILLNTLAPEVSRNEDKKREHKDKLIKYVSIFLGTQFLVIFVLVMTIIISTIVFHACLNDFSDGMLKMIFAFFGTYISSVIVELIFILKYIVVNVFDTSISALMEIFKTQIGKSKEQEN